MVAKTFRCDRCEKFEFDINVPAAVSVVQCVKCGRDDSVVRIFKTAPAVITGGGSPPRTLGFRDERSRTEGSINGSPWQPPQDIGHHNRIYGTLGITDCDTGVRVDGGPPLVIDRIKAVDTPKVIDVGGNGHVVVGELDATMKRQSNQ